MAKSQESASATPRYMPILLAFAVILFGTTYFIFTEYKPKIVKQVEDVKSPEAGVISDVPIIEGAEKTSVNKSSESTQTTFHTNKTKEEVQDYYKNIFSSNKWVVESQGTYADFMVAKYKKGDQEITITTYDTNNDYKTLVSLEITNQ